MQGTSLLVERMEHKLYFKARIGSKVYKQSTLDLFWCPPSIFETPIYLSTKPQHMGQFPLAMTLPESTLTWLSVPTWWRFHWPRVGSPSSMGQEAGAYSKSFMFVFVYLSKPNNERLKSVGFWREANIYCGRPKLLFSYFRDYLVRVVHKETVRRTCFGWRCHVVIEFKTWVLNKLLYESGCWPWIGSHILPWYGS